MNHWTLQSLYRCNDCDWIGTVAGYCPYCHSESFTYFRNSYRSLLDTYSAIDEPTKEDAVALHEDLAELLGLSEFLTLSCFQQRICFRIAEHSVLEALAIAYDIERANEFAQINISELTQLLLS